MTRVLSIAGALLVALVLLAPAVLAADGDTDRGRVLISVSGDVDIPAGDQADVVVIVDGTATIAGTVRSIVAVDATLEMTGATVENVVAVRTPVTVGPAPS
jgi:hypothetical protein